MGGGVLVLWFPGLYDADGDFIFLFYSGELDVESVLRLYGWDILFFRSCCFMYQARYYVTNFLCYSAIFSNNFFNY